MSRIQTQINGISTTSAYEEGDCYSLVNLRKKNGALQAVTPRKTIKTLSEKYDIIFLHQRTNGSSMIGVKHYSIAQSDIIANIDTTPVSMVRISRVSAIEQIGNALSFITASGIEYMLYKKNTYEHLGKLPELRPMPVYLGNDSTFFIEYYVDHYTSVSRDQFKEATIGLFNIARIKAYEGFNGGLVDNHLMIYAFRLYDGSVIRQSSPVLLPNSRALAGYMTIGDSLFLGDSGDLRAAHVRVYPKRVYLDVDLSYLTGWEDIIKSVDVYISQGLGYVAESNMQNVEMVDSPSGSHDHPILGNQSAMINSIKNAGLFYLVDSIPSGTVNRIAPSLVVNPNTNIWIPQKAKLDNIDNLIYQERLPVDSFSHHTITGATSYVYNARLHLADVSTALFNGFTADHFKLMHKQGDNMTYNGFALDAYTDYIFPRGIFIEVDIIVNGETHTVRSKSVVTPYFMFNAYFSYPDPRATKVRFYSNHEYSGWADLIYEDDLIASQSLSLAFCLAIHEEENNDRPFPPIPITATAKIHPDPPIAYYTEPNKIKVSELNNPFMFPNANTYIAGNGRVLAMASVAVRIAEGQFGQFPLYVFTTQGIYSLQVGNGDVLYSQLSAPTSLEAPISNIIRSTPFGVVFVSNRGVCMISGQNVSLLTQQLKESPTKLVFQDAPELNGILLNYGGVSFTEYIKGIEDLLYDSHENELIISDKDSPFNFVYRFDDGLLYQSTEKISLEVKNTFPELLIVSDFALKDFAQEGSTDVAVSLITRPLRFTTPDIKKLERMILRGELHLLNPTSGKNCYALNYFSNDETNFSILRGIPLSAQSRKDIDMGLFSRSKYRQFAFAFGGKINNKTIIRYLEAEVEKEYENDKMR